MKKYSLLILIVLLATPFVVYAANEPEILTLESTASGTTISYNGTIEDEATAVMCKLYNSSNEEIDLLSSAVDNGEFNGEFTVTSNGDYKVTCANYEGGTIKATDVTVTSNTNTNTTTTNDTTTTKDSPQTKANSPKTLDDIMKYFILLIISFIGLISIILLKRKIKNKNEI